MQNQNVTESNKIYRSGKPGWFWPTLLLLLVIGWLAFYIKCCSGIYGGAQEMCKKECCAKPAEAGKQEHHKEDKMHTADMSEHLDANGNYIINTGADTEIALPDGSKMTVGENSTESKLFAFLSDESAQVSEDKSKGWITLDRVYFETGNAVLTPESKKQLENISRILKNFPNAIIKMGGYTDNTGSLDVNMTVSTERANAAMSSLVNLGVSEDRVSAEGYGPEHPVCPENDTKECQAQNRRVDVRVKAK